MFQPDAFVSAVTKQHFQCDHATPCQCHSSNRKSRRTCFTKSGVGGRKKTQQLLCLSATTTPPVNLLFSCIFKKRVKVMCGGTQLLFYGDFDQRRCVSPVKKTKHVVPGQSGNYSSTAQMAEWVAGFNDLVSPSLFWCTGVQFKQDLLFSSAVCVCAVIQWDVHIQYAFPFCLMSLIRPYLNTLLAFR